ncbi:hypothetical protein N7466_006666 [Penicillium verhagenii]|uniref:uncharacterized protein n=1 Tax=Penicillium verhagenii TaxID=1562060 RepID=UPI002544F0C7|nr:uncharacterized protein N7466_006666 [Penicillium verhagenii]KAJ5927710.1 hypothetical protein N7466_006666 [Penicillium verhagenii]
MGSLFTGIKTLILHEDFGCDVYLLPSQDGHLPASESHGYGRESPARGVRLPRRCLHRQGH